MAIISFQLNQQIKVDGQKLEVVNRLQIGEDIHVQLLNLKEKTITTIRESELVNQLLNKSIDIVTTDEKNLYSDCDLSQIDEDIKVEVNRRAMYVERYIEYSVQKRRSKDIRKKVIEIVAKQIFDMQPPSEVTLYRWTRSYEKCGGDKRSLIPLTNLRGSRKHKIGDRLSDIIETAIREVYMTRQRESVQKVYDRVAALVLLENRKREECDKLLIPHRATIYRHVNSKYEDDPYAVDSARFGQRYADKKHKSYKRGPRPTRPLERVEADSTKIDVIVIDEDTNKIIGRAWLTIMICCYSKQILGYYVSFEPPSYLSLAECIKHAIIPKEYVKEKYPDIQSTWESYGIPEEIVCDNGRDYTSNHFKDACRGLGCDIKYMPPRTPWWKPTVERLFRTANSNVFHRIPGTTFSNYIDKDEYKSEEFAVMTMPQLDKIIHHWIVDIYQMDWHGGINARPRDRWMEGIKEHEPRFPENLTDLLPVLGAVVERVIQRKGIELDGIIYDCDELKKMRVKLKGDKVRVKYRPADLSLIWVYDKAIEKYIPVPAIDQDYTNGLTKWVHQLNKKVAQEKYGEVSPENIILAKNYLWELLNYHKSDPKRKKIGTKAGRALKIGITNSNPVVDENPISIVKRQSPANIIDQDPIENNKIKVRVRNFK